MTHKTPSRGLALRALSLGIAAALAAPVVSAQSLPTGGAAVTTPGGTAPTITTTGNTMTVTPGGTRSLINWNSFDVASGFTFQFNASGSNDILLNRVTGANFSAINGAINSSGHVWLLNPNGILVGGTATFDTAGLLLSTGNITDSDFFGADNTFAITGATSSISVAQGARLSSSSSPGAIALIADTIAFNGTANAGTTGQTAVVGARGVSVTFDANLDAYTTLTITEGSGTAGNAVTVGNGSAFSGNKTVIAAAGMMDGAGNVLLDNGGANTVAFNSGDIVLFAAANAGGGTSRNVIAATGRTQQTGTATTGAARVQIMGNLGGATQDLDIRSAGAADFSSVTLQGRDVAIGSSNSVAVGVATAQDDLVIRSRGITVSGRLTSGASNGAVDTDFSGAADYLQTTTMSGNDMSLYADETTQTGTRGTLTVNVAPFVGDGYRIRASEFFGPAVFTPTFTQGTENTFVITDTFGGFNTGSLSSPGRLWIEAQNGGDLNVDGALGSTRGDIQLITSGGGNINLSANVTSGANGGSAGNEFLALRSSGAINQTAGIINTTLSTTGSLYASAATGISLGQNNQFATAAFQNTGAGGILVRNAGSYTLAALSPDSFNPLISGATTGSGNVDLGATGTLTLGAVPVSTGAGDVTFNAAMQLAAGARTVTATGGTVTFANTIDGQAGNTGDLTVNANGATFRGNIGATNALGSLTVNGATTLVANTVSAANGIDLDDVAVAGTLSGNATLNTNGALTLGNVAANHAGTFAGTGASVSMGSFTGSSASLTTTGGTLSFGPVTAGGAVTLTSVGGDIVGTTVEAAGDVTVNAGGALRANALRSSGGGISATASGTLGGNAAGTRMEVSASNDVTLDAGGAALLGTVESTAGGVTAAANGLDSTAANAAGALSLSGGAGGIALGSASGTSASLTTTGALNVAGTLTTDLLTGSAGGGATLNGANQIAELGTFTASSLSLANARALAISGVVDTGAGDASIAVTGGDLSIDATGQVRGAGVDLSTDATFTNASGSDAVVASNRWVIYSQAPAGNTFDGLNSNNTALWNATRATLAPSAVNANRYVFAFQPRLTLTTTSVSKTYGTDLTANPGVAFSITGYQPGVTGAFLGDSQATVFSGTPRVASAGFAARASVNGGPYGITVDPASLATNSGYGVDVSNAGTVTVTPLAIGGTVNADNKTYDGTTAGTGSVTLNGVLAGDSVSATGTTFTFADKNAGTGKTVNVAGTTLAGADAGNYTLTLPATAVADILRRALTASVTVGNKTYDGTVDASGSISLTGVVAGDSVATTGTTFAFADRNAGTGKTVNVGGTTLTGADAGNYTLTVPATAIADILARAITVSADPKSKQVGAPDPALTYTVTSGSLVSGDSLNGSLARQPGEAAGTYAINQGTLSASTNYRLTFVGSTLTITPEPSAPVPPPTPATPGRSFASETVDLLDRVDDRTPGALRRGDALQVIDERDCEGEGGSQRPGCPSAQPN